MGGVAWTEEEDQLLKRCVEQYGEGKWHRIPLLAGINRCRKSCRLRWINYLRPNIRRGTFTQEEVDIIIKLHKLLGNRWSLIASRLPGRTANGVKNYWNCHLSKKQQLSLHMRDDHHEEISSSSSSIVSDAQVIRPRPRNFARKVAADSRTSMSCTEGAEAPSVVNLQEVAVPAHIADPRELEEENKSKSNIEACAHIGDWLIDYEIEQVKITGDNSKYSHNKWDLDDLMFDMDLWTD